MKKEAWITISLGLLLILSIIWQIEPFRAISNWRTSMKSTAKYDTDFTGYQIYDYSKGEIPWIKIDFKKGKHFWNPQMAFWIEDTAGNFIKTLFVTTSTAKGLFYGGRSAENFKDFDGVKTTESKTVRRVNALPHWSYKRGQMSADGSYAPHPDQPLTDAITGATPTDNFFHTSPLPSAQVYNLSSLVIKMEVNVAFDENEYYSEYDYLDDEIYHGGTGLLGQPSLIYEARASRTDSQNFYLMQLLGHGHHSGLNGDVEADLKEITTALEIVERVVIEVNF